MVLLETFHGKHIDDYSNPDTQVINFTYMSHHFDFYLDRYPFLEIYKYVGRLQWYNSYCIWRIGREANSNV